MLMYVDISYEILGSKMSELSVTCQNALLLEAGRKMHHKRYNSIVLLSGGHVIITSDSNYYITE